MAAGADRAWPSDLSSGKGCLGYASQLWGVEAQGKVATQQTGLLVGSECICQPAPLLLPGLAETGNFLRLPALEEAVILGPDVHFSSHCVIKG